MHAAGGAGATHIITTTNIPNPQHLLAVYLKKTSIKPRPSICLLRIETHRTRGLALCLCIVWYYMYMYMYTYSMYVCRMVLST